MFYIRGMFVLAALAVMVCPAHAIVIRHDVDVAEYVALQNHPLFQCVGRVQDPNGGYGSGTLVATDWVLTAAHLKTTTNQFLVNGTTYYADQFIQHPNWDGDYEHGYDLALLHLTTPVTDTTPALLYERRGEKGREAVLVGYGGFGTGDVGIVKYNKLRHAAMNWIDVVSGGTLQTDFDNPNDPSDSHYGSTTPLHLEGTIAPGDSGGGLFILSGDLSDDQCVAFLAGVNSWYSWGLDGTANADYGDAAGYSRVSTNYDWIHSVISITVPEPSTLCLLGIACMALLFWRRMRKA